MAMDFIWSFSTANDCGEKIGHKDAIGDLSLTINSQLPIFIPHDWQFRRDVRSSPA